jgi:hypothetical protein
MIDSRGEITLLPHYNVFPAFQIATVVVGDIPKSHGLEQRDEEFKTEILL